MSDVMRQEYKVLSETEKAQLKAVKDAGQAFFETLGSESSRELSLAKTKIEEAVMWAVKHITAPVLLLLLVGCAPLVEVHKVGNEYAEHKYSRNAWWPNWDRTIFCPALDKNGFCPADSEKHTVTAQEASGQKAAVAAAGTAPIAAGLAVMPRAKTTQSVNGSQSQVNKNVPVFESPGAVVK